MHANNHHLYQKLLLDGGNFMNYKNLVFAVLMAVSCMNHGLEPIKSQNSSWPGLSWGSWALGAATLGMSAKCVYHYTQVERHRRQCYKYDNASKQIRYSHNQKVINTARDDVTQTNITHEIVNMDIKGENALGHIIPDIAEIVGSYHEGIAWKDSKLRYHNTVLFLEKNRQWFSPVMIGNNSLDVRGTFKELTNQEFLSLVRDKQQACREINTNFKNKKLRISKMNAQRDNFKVAGGLAVIGGTYWLSTYLDSRFK